MDNFFTSLKTSERLKEWGCDVSPIEIFLINGDSYYGYHLLEDICVRYAKEFFRNSAIDDIPADNTNIPMWAVRTFEIVGYLQKNKKEEAEKYLLSHTVYNPSNRT